MEKGICEAIATKNVVQFYYDGGMRTVEPHCYGKSSMGSDVLRGYQTAGYSDSPIKTGWKLFDVSKISSWRLSARVFEEGREGYSPQDRVMSEVYCCL